MTGAVSAQGHVLGPAMRIGASARHGDMRINREKISGAVATVMRVADADAALVAANDTAYGLSTPPSRGIVMVNAPTAGVDPYVPFGGRKASSHGPREQGRCAAELYTTVRPRTSTFNLRSARKSPSNRKWRARATGRSACALQ